MAVVVAASLLLVAAGDWWLRNREYRGLLVAVEASEGRLKEFKSAEAAANQEFSKNLALVGEAGAVARFKLVTVDACAKSATEALAAQDGVSRVDILPWHRNLLAARAAYLRHSRAWSDHLLRCSRDAVEVVRKTPQIDATWVAFKPRIRDARPMPSLFGLAARTERLLAD